MWILPFLVVVALLGVLVIYSILITKYSDSIDALSITQVWTWLRKNHAPIDSAAQLLLGGAVVFTAWTFFDNYTLKQERLVLITDRAKSVPEIDDEWGQLTSVSESEAAQCPTPPPPCDSATQNCILTRQYKVHERLFYNHKAWIEILNLPYFLNGCIDNYHCDEPMTLDFFLPWYDQIGCYIDGAS